LLAQGKTAGEEFGLINRLTEVVVREAMA